MYAEGLPKSKLARDPLYVLGDPNGVVPEPAPPPAFPEALGPVEADMDAHVKAKADADVGAGANEEANGHATAHDPSEAETADPPAVAERPATEAH